MTPKEILSNELAEEVLGLRFTDASMSTRGDNPSFTYGIGAEILMGGRGAGQWSDTINAYEYAHKCKAWAHKQGHSLITYYMEDVDAWQCDITFNTEWKYKDLMGNGIIFGVGKSKEYEAIISACEEILRLKNIKGNE